MKDIDILIVNYNNLEYTKNCILDLGGQINKNFSIYLVDQNSNEEGTADYLKSIEHCKHIKIFKNDSNVDLNRVWNWFYKNSKSKYLCFLNNDIRLTNNFTDDIFNIFNLESNVGIVIHVTNNLKYVKSEFKLNYEILSPPLYQGWDFCIRRECYVEIPEVLRIFGGDDLIFAHVNGLGYKIALTYSSPIIHYKEKTRIKFKSSIDDIQRKDSIYFLNELQKRKLNAINLTVSTNKCNKYPPDKINLQQNKNCIFTTIINNYDNLPNLKVKKEENWDYICFTDDENLKSDIWKVIYVKNDNIEILENHKLSRYYKTNFYNYLSSYDNLLYIDARMDIVNNINNYLNELSNNDFVFLKHPISKNIKEEMKTLLDLQLEKREVIHEIESRYDKLKYKYDNGLYAGGILLFKNNKKTVDFFKDWWCEIKNYSHRDQLSLNFILSKHELKIKTKSFNEVVTKYFKQRIRKNKRLTFKK